MGTKDDDPATNLIDISGTGDLTVGATAKGAITPSAIAGSFSTAGTVDNQIPAADDLSESSDLDGFGEELSVRGSTIPGWGFSGAVAVAKEADTVAATVNHGGTMTAGGGLHTLTVSALNTTTVGAIAGALTIRNASNSDSVSAGISGAVSWIKADSTVLATINGPQINNYLIDLSAENNRTLFAFAVGGAGGTAGGDFSTTVNFAGSLAVESISTTTLARLERVTGLSLGDVKVQAITRDFVLTVAGTMVANLSSSLDTSSTYNDSYTDAGRSIGVGISVAIVSASVTTQATISDSNLTLSGGNLSTTASDDSTVVTVSAGGTFVSTGSNANVRYGSDATGKAGSAVAAMVAVVDYDPTVEALILGSTINMAQSGGDVSVLASTTVLMATASGAILVNRDGRSSGSASVGAAVTVVNSTSRGSAKIDENSKVYVPQGKVRVRSTNGNPDDAMWRSLDPIFSQMNMPEAGSGSVWTFAIGAVASDSTVSLAASVNVTEVNVYQTATIGGGSEVNAASVEATAINSSKIRAVAGSVALTAFTSDKSALSAGAAVLVTTLGGETKATIDASSVTATDNPAVDESGRVAVTAADTSDLLSIAASGVVSGENALSAALLFNDLEGRKVTAAITGSDAQKSSVKASKAIDVKALDAVTVLAVAGQVAIPASTSAAVSAGAAGAMNWVDAEILAKIDHATIDAPAADITVDAESSGSITSWAVGVSGALTTNSDNGMGGFSFAGAGSFTANRVVRHTDAIVGVGANITANSLEVTAKDSAEIFSVAGALAAQVGSSASLAAGISVAINENGNDANRSRIKASVEGANITLGGNLDVLATNASKITTWTIAGTGQVTAGKGWSAGAAVAGAVSMNNLNVDTLAVIQAGATVVSAGSITVTAADSSKIESKAGAGSLGIALSSSAALEVAVGAAINDITITNSARAAIELASVQAVGDISLSASSAQVIEAVAAGVAISVAAGSTAIAAAGSGAKVDATLGTTTLAEILSANATAGTAGNGSVSLVAEDKPKISTEAGAGSLSVAVGSSAVGLAAGVILANTTTTNTIAARIGTAQGSSQTPVVEARGSGRVTVSAESAATIDSIAVAVAVAAAFSDKSFAASASYAEANASIANTVTAEISSGSVKAPSVSVSAIDDHSITNTVGTGAAAIGMFGASVGLSYAEATVADSVSATIAGAAVTATAGDINVAARSANSLDTHTVATAMTIGIGGSGRGGESLSKDTSTVSASVSSGARIVASGILNVIAGGSETGGYGALKAQTDGGSLGLGTVGVSYATAESSVDREASIGSGLDLSSVAGLSVDTKAEPNL